jgi:hypothetical protein
MCARRTRRWSRGSWYCTTCDRPVRWRAYAGWKHVGPKRLTTEELTAEWARAAAVVGIHGPYVWGEQVAALARMVQAEHAGDNEYL